MVGSLRALAQSRWRGCASPSPLGIYDHKIVRQYDISHAPAVVGTKRADPVCAPKLVDLTGRDGSNSNPRSSKALAVSRKSESGGARPTFMAFFADGVAILSSHCRPWCATANAWSLWRGRGSEIVVKCVECAEKLGPLKISFEEHQCATCGRSALGSFPFSNERRRY
jgi:hypothetical protein